eukprot:s619_g1.t1
MIRIVSVSGEPLASLDCEILATSPLGFAAAVILGVAFVC